MAVASGKFAEAFIEIRIREREFRSEIRRFEATLPKVSDRFSNKLSISPTLKSSFGRSFAEIRKKLASFVATVEKRGGVIRITLDVKGVTQQATTARTKLVDALKAMRAKSEVKLRLQDKDFRSRLARNANTFSQRMAQLKGAANLRLRINDANFKQKMSQSRQRFNDSLSQMNSKAVVKMRIQDNQFWQKISQMKQKSHVSLQLKTDAFNQRLIQSNQRFKQSTDQMRRKSMVKLTLDDTQFKQREGQAATRFSRRMLEMQRLSVVRLKLNADAFNQKMRQSTVRFAQSMQQMRLKSTVKLQLQSAAFQKKLAQLQTIGRVKLRLQSDAFNQKLNQSTKRFRQSMSQMNAKSKVSLRLDDAKFQQKQQQARNKHSRVMGEMQSKSTLKIRLDDSQAVAKSRRLAAQFASQAAIMRSRSAIQMQLSDEKFRQRLQQVQARHNQTLANMKSKSSVTLGIRDAMFRKKLAGAGRLVTQFSTRSRAALASFGGAFTGVMAAVGFTGMARGIMGVAGSFLSANANMERYRISMGVLLKDQKKANDLIQEIEDFAKVTPFETENLVSSVQLLKKFGIETSKIMPMMQSIGDAAAASPAGMEEAVHRISLAIGQMKAAGKIQGQDVLQLVNAGVPVAAILERAYGKSFEEVKRLSQSGKLAIDDVIDNLMKGLDSDFGGMMKKQSRTWGGLMSTMRDNAVIAARNIGAPFFDLAKLHLTNLVDWLETDEAEAWINTIRDGLKTIIDTAVMLANSPLAQAVAKFAAMTGGVVALSAAWGLVVSGATMLAPILAPAMAIVAAMWAGVKSFNAALDSPSGQKLRDTLAETKGLIVEIWHNIRDGIGGAISWVSGLWSGVFGKSASSTNTAFWDSVLTGVRNFADWISLLSSNWAMTWEFAKVQGLLFVSVMVDRFKWLFSSYVPALIGGLINGAIAGGGVLVESWKTLFVAWVTSFKEQFDAIINTIKARLDVLKKFWDKIRSGDWAGAEEERYAGIGEANRQFLADQIEAQRKYAEVVGGVLGEAASKAADEMQKVMDAMPTASESESNGTRDLRGESDSILAKMLAERERKRKERAESLGLPEPEVSEPETPSGPGETPRPDLENKDKKKAPGTSFIDIAELNKQIQGSLKVSDEAAIRKTSELTLAEMRSANKIAADQLRYNKLVAAGMAKFDNPHLKFET